jgi:hypothetical protein
MMLLASRCFLKKNAACKVWGLCIVSRIKPVFCVMQSSPSQVQVVVLCMCTLKSDQGLCKLDVVKDADMDLPPPGTRHDA